MLAVDVGWCWGVVYSQINVFTKINDQRGTCHTGTLQEPQPVIHFRMRTVLLVAAAQQAAAWHIPAAIAPSPRVHSPIMSLGDSPLDVARDAASPIAKTMTRRSVLIGGAVMMPLAAKADVYSDLGVTRSQLGLPEPPSPPPAPPVDAKTAAKLLQDEKRAAAKQLAEEKKAAAAAARLEKKAADDEIKAAKAAKVAAEKEAKAQAAAQRKELEELGLTPEQLGLAGAPPKPSKPLTASQKRQQKKKAEEKKRKRAQKKLAAKQEKELAQKEAEVAKKAADATKKALEFYQSELPKKQAEVAKKEAALEKAVKKERSI